MNEVDLGVLEGLLVGFILLHAATSGMQRAATNRTNAMLEELLGLLKKQDKVLGRGFGRGF